MAKDQMLLQQAMRILWMDTGFIYLFHRGWDQVCDDICRFANFAIVLQYSETSSVNLDRQNG